MDAAPLTRGELLSVPRPASRSRPALRAPEREPREGTIERLYHAARGRSIGRLTRLRRAVLARFADAVDAQAGAVRTLSDEALRQAIEDVRTHVRRRGFAGESGIRATALLRELAARRLGLRPHLVQLMGAAGVLHGWVIEMEAGEGKTLTAVMPAAILAFAGLPVHVVTANDYLAVRDAEIMRPFYAALGLTVGCVGEGMPPDARRAAYAAAVTYASGKEVTFDYLRDRLAGAGNSDFRIRLDTMLGRTRSDRMAMRGLGACIVDEADSVLIDEARTPLILSEKEEGGFFTGKVLSEALDVAAGLQEGRHFVLRPRAHFVGLTDEGEAVVEAAGDAHVGAWKVPLLRNDLVHKALSAMHLFRREEHYILKDGKVAIVDDNTGRTMADRTWSEGLHQMIEVKEGLEPSAINRTLAKTSFQRFFRRYQHLSGMSGTLKEVAAELWSVYRLKVVDIPTRLPSRRQHLESRLFPQAIAKWAHVAETVETVSAEGRAVLVGVRSVEASRAASLALAARGIAHAVLHAGNHAEEAEVIAAAGQTGAVTVATGMAGRGTDIALAPEVRKAGGLHVIIAERHDSSRVDRQFAGRSARQGDPGSVEYLLSLEDRVTNIFNVRLWRIVAGRLGRADARLGLAALRLAQLRIEAAHRSARSRLARHDEEIERMLAFAGERE